jgi:hypothetical protein
MNDNEIDRSDIPPLPKDFFLKEMVRRKCKYGVSSACIGSGLGIAIVWENLTI